MKRSPIMMSALLFVTAMLLSGCICPCWDYGYHGYHGGYHGGGYYNGGGRR